MIRLLFIFILFQTYTFILGQDSTVFKTKHLFSIETGYSKHLVQDDIISPLLYKGSQVPVCLNSTFIIKKSVHRFYIYFDYLKLTSSITIKSPVEAFYTKNYNTLIQYTYNRKLYDFSGCRLIIYTGAEIKALINQRDHYYSNYTHYNSGEFVTNLGFSLLAIKAFDVSDNFLSFRYTMSILSFDALNYKYNANVAKELNSESFKNSSGNLVKTNRLVTMNKYFEFQTELSYFRFITKHFGFNLNYRFQYYHSEKFEDIMFVRNVCSQYLFGLTFKL